MTKNPVLFSALEELLAAYARVIRAWSEPREFWCFDIDDKVETVKILGRQRQDLVIRVDDARQALLNTDFDVPDTWLAIRVQPTIRYFRADQQVKPPIPASGTDIEKRGHSAIRDAPGEWYVVADPLDPEPLAAVCREIDAVMQRLRAGKELVIDKKSATNADAESGPMAGDGSTAAKSKRRGRKKADYKTIQREAELAAKWERARKSNVSKAKFAKDKGGIAKFDKLLDRVAKRERNAAKQKRDSD
jgi:hypothetical protein